MLTDCLKGLRVLDLSQYIPGPYATLMLADLGAEVVKIEPPAGDPMRGFGPPGPGGVTPFYSVLNRSKTVVRMDLKRPAEAAAFAGLVEKADVLMESFRPGTLARLGFGRERLVELNPRLVHCALSGFGQDGPYRLRAGHDITYMALAGGLAQQGDADTPVLIYPPLADHAGAVQAATAILAALLRRERAAGGGGAFLDVSLFEAGLAWQYMALNHPAGRRATELLNGGAAYYRVYRAADGRFLALGAIEDKFWAGFCAAIGRPDLVARHHEPLPQSALISALEALIASRPLADWLELLGPADCCAEAVAEPAAVPADPHVMARGLLRAGADGLLDMLFPCLLDGAPPPARRPLREEPAAVVVAEWGV